MSAPRKLEREQQILWMLKHGRSAKAVGRHFGISDSRVRYIRDRNRWELDHNTEYFTARRG